MSVTIKTIHGKQSAHVPQKFRALFWDTDLKNINLKKHREYVIQRILEFGNLDSVRWIQNIYPTKEIIKTCLTNREVSPQSKNFWKIWFGTAHAH